MQAFGEYFLQKRLDAGLNLKQAAEKCGIPHMTLGRLEKCQSDPTVYTVMRLCRGWNLHLYDLADAIDFPLMHEYLEFYPVYSDKSSKAPRYRDQVSKKLVIELYHWAVRNPSAPNSLLDRVERYLRVKIDDTNLLKVFDQEMWGWDKSVVSRFSFPPSLAISVVLDLYDYGGAVTYRDLSIAIRHFRNQKNLRLADMAELAGLSTRFMSQVESGKLTNLVMKDVLVLDKVLDGHGSITELAWAATELWEGMLLNRGLPSDVQDKDDFTLWQQNLGFLLSFISFSRWSAVDDRFKDAITHIFTHLEHLLTEGGELL